MTKTLDLLNNEPLELPGRQSIIWSQAYLDTFRAIIVGTGPIRSRVDIDLAPIFLLYAAGEFASADLQLFEVGRVYVDMSKTDTETFISLLFAFFVAQRFDVVAALLVDRFGFEASLKIDAQSDGPGIGQVLWTIDGDSEHRFDFDTQVYLSDKTRNEIMKFQWIFPLIAYYTKLTSTETGSVIINQGDIGVRPGLAYCDNRPNYFLIPDYIFIPSRGYAYHKSQLNERAVPWSERKSVAMWRGATTGVPAKPNDWRSLERVRMCETLRNCGADGLFDVGLSSIIQFADPRIVKEIEGSGLRADFIPADKWYEYKYLIDIDGNSSPWSNLFQKLITGSTVLKVESRRGLQQWYYDSLRPWINYVPISSDFSDIVEKVQWLCRHDSVARAIGRAGRDLAYELSYERELERSVPVISAAFRYFRGDLKDVAPFGRVAPDNSLRKM